MVERLTERRRVEDEGLRVVNSCHGLNDRALIVCGLTKAREEATANSLPAAAVIQRWQALLGITGHKGRLGGAASRL